MKFFSTFLLALVAALVVAPGVVHGRLSWSSPTEEELDEEFERFLTDSSGDDCVGSNCNAGGGGCFSERSTVWTSARGVVSVKDLQVGDVVLTKSGHYQPVYAWAHREPARKATFLQIHTNNDKAPLEVTGEHLIYLHDKVHPVRADSIQVGDHLRMKAGGEVQKIETIERQGLYAPLTLEGSVVVDGVAASNYIAFQQENEEVLKLGGISTGLAHHDYVDMVLSPFRSLCFGVSHQLCQEHDPETGMPYYISYGVQLNEWVNHKEQNRIVQAVLMIAILAITGVCWMVEGMVGPTLAPLLVAALGALYALTTRYRLAIRKVKTA